VSVCSQCSSRNVLSSTCKFVAQILNLSPDTTAAALLEWRSVAHACLAVEHAVATTTAPRFRRTKKEKITASSFYLPSFLPSSLSLRVDVHVETFLNVNLGFIFLVSVLRYLM
jgi:hypothetical protein